MRPLVSVAGPSTVHVVSCPATPVPQMSNERAEFAPGAALKAAVAGNMSAAKLAIMVEGLADSGAKTERPTLVGKKAEAQAGAMTATIGTEWEGLIDAPPKPN